VSDLTQCPYWLGIGDQKCNQGCYDYPRCSDLGPPSKAERAAAILEEMAPDLLRINIAAAETAARIMVRLRKA
jgi:hypothetical protein